MEGIVIRVKADGRRHNFCQRFVGYQVLNAVFLVEIQAWGNIVPAERSPHGRADNGINGLLILVFDLGFCGVYVDVDLRRVDLDKEHIKRIGIFGQ